MEYRKIATGMIEATYEAFKEWKNPTRKATIFDNDSDLEYELNKHGDIPVWSKMDTDSKCAAIEYVYKNRDTLELHSGCVSSMVQATAYFMIYDFVTNIIFSKDDSGIPEIEMFFDDLDFMSHDEYNTEEVLVFPADGSKAGPEANNFDSSMSKLCDKAVAEDHPS
jgi:hypothetical protein